ncbi:MAG: glycosyltransferase family 4 protein, partial [Acetobacteraceae bacterium]
NNGGVIMPGLTATLKRIDPQVLHAHQIAAPAWAHAAAWVAWRRGRKFFYSPHFHPDTEGAGWLNLLLLRALNRLPIRSARRIFHLTSRDFGPFAAEYPEARPERFAVLYNGVMPPLPLPRPDKPEGALDLLFVGRVDDHRKGFDLLRAAFAERRRAGWRLTVIGRIAEATKAALESEFGEAVRVLGPVPERRLEEAYAEADVFVMPSRYEGFGMPYIEAMRYGCAVIGTATGGTPEIVPDGTGLLVPPDDLAALADAIERVGGDAGLRARLGEAGRAWSAGFHWSRIVDQLEHAYSTA